MTNIQREVLLEAIELLKKFPDNATVWREQSAIIRRILREIEP